MILCLLGAWLLVEVFQGLRHEALVLAEVPASLAKQTVPSFWASVLLATRVFEFGTCLRLGGKIKKNCVDSFAV